MLSNYPIDIVLLAMDLAAAKAFYADKIGLPVRSRGPGRGDVSMWRRHSFSGHEEQRGDQGRADASSLPRSHLRAEVSELRRRGVKIEDYDIPGFKTDEGIADIGFAWMAWFIDPGKNCVGLIQLKNP